MKTAKRKGHRHLAATSNQKVTERLIPRKAVLDMERGVTTAMNVKQSKFGKALLTALTHDDFVLTTTLNVLRAQSARTQAHYDQQRRAFIHRLQVLPDPTILLERPPSPVRSHHSRAEPGYMRATAAKPNPQRAVNFATIDAYSVEKSRMVPAWEVSAPPNVRNTRFRCLVRPSPPLSRFEKHDLVRGLTFHARNTATQPPGSGGIVAPPRHATKSKRRLAVKAKVQAIVQAEEAQEKKAKDVHVFVTEVSETKMKKKHKDKLAVERQVSFTRSPTHDSAQFSLYDGSLHDITIVEEEPEIEKPVAPAKSVSKKDAKAKGMSIPHIGSAKGSAQSATTNKSSRPTSASKKHKTAKHKQEQTKYRRAGLSLVPA